MRQHSFQRYDAVKYARQWAYKRNPAYLDFDFLGGDCTNFVSQCIYAGCGVMNYTPTYGWYYITSENRTASWTGVNYLYEFLVNNREEGPFATQVSLEETVPGDIIQLSNGEKFYHSLFVTQVNPFDADTAENLNQILVTTHTFDSMDRKLGSYVFHSLRVLHILGYRT